MQSAAQENIDHSDRHPCSEILFPSHPPFSSPWWLSPVFRFLKLPLLYTPVENLIICIQEIGHQMGPPLKCTKPTYLTIFLFVLSSLLPILYEADPYTWPLASTPATLSGTNGQQWSPNSSVSLDLLAPSQPCLSVLSSPYLNKSTLEPFSCHCTPLFTAMFLERIIYPNYLLAFLFSNPVPPLQLKLLLLNCKQPSGC